ncbi:MAG: hypothetical protein LBE50_05385, partial [Gallionellaceae bacterium]|nr:hypothetical protein [Gallionellaceae bacterium]
RLATQYGEAAAPLLDIHADHDGAVLFIVKGEPGFCMASVGEWDQLKTEVMEWAQQVTWQEDPEEIPKYLHTAIAFGVIPGDSEKWLLITEGEHAGKIMLSDGDVIEDTPRYDSLAEFFAALLCDPAQVLNCGGYIDYGDDLVPIAYRHD